MPVKEKLLCGDCRLPIPKGSRYINKLTSTSISDDLDFDFPNPQVMKKEINRLVKSVNYKKNEQELMDEVFIELKFQLCRKCREKFLKSIKKSYRVSAR